MNHWQRELAASAIFVITYVLISGRRPARSDLLTVATDLRIKRAGPSVEPHLVFCGWIKRFLKRAVRVGGGKLDRAIRGTDFDVEGAGTRDDVCRQSHDRRFGGKYDRG